jgi:hypothetical protein
MRKRMVCAGLALGVLLPGSEALAFCPSSLSALDRIQCQQPNSG